jgi:hypothetical protein
MLFDATNRQDLHDSIRLKYLVNYGQWRDDDQPGSAAARFTVLVWVHSENGVKRRRRGSNAGPIPYGQPYLGKSVGGRLFLGDCVPHDSFSRARTSAVV